MQGLTLVCKDCPKNPVLELRGGDKLCCPICGKVHVEKFKEIQGQNLTHAEFVFEVSPKDILTVNLIKGDGSGMKPILKRTVPETIYTGGRKKIKGYIIKARYDLAVVYEE